MRRRAALAWATFALASLLLLPACGKRNQYVEPPPPEVSVAQPIAREVTDYLVFTGSTRATKRISLRARVNGYLKSIDFKDGEVVKKGELLFVIEPEPFQVALAAAQAALQKAEASLKLAIADVGRTQPLVKRGALPEQELDTKVAAEATARADVATAKAAVRQAELNLAYTRITAEITGRMDRHMVDVGNLVQAETTVLSTLESFDPIYAYFTVSEADALRLRKLTLPKHGKPAEPMKISLSLANEDKFTHEGTLDFSEFGVDTSTGTQLCRGVFPNADGSLLPGLFVRIRLSMGKPEQRLLIGERAVAADQRGEYVLVVNDKNIVEYRPVKLGQTIDGMRVVLDGLTANEWIVVNGLQRARPSKPVTPKRESQAVAAIGASASTTKKTPPAATSDKAAPADHPGGK